MGIWTWIAAGVALVILSTLAGLLLAGILGRIAEDVTDLLDRGAWALAPPSRSREAPNGLERTCQRQAHPDRTRTI